MPRLDYPAGYSPMASRSLVTELVKPPKIGETLAQVLMALLVLLGIALFLPWQQNIRADGAIVPLRPDERPQEIPATVGGRIAKWYVQEGQIVKAGDTILQLAEANSKYFDPQTLARLEEQVDAKLGSVRASSQKVGALENQIGALEAGLRISLSKARNKVKQTQAKVKAEQAELNAQRQALAIGKRQLAGFDSLYKQGLRSLTELENRQNRVIEIQNKYLAAEQKLDQAQTEEILAVQELTSLEAEYLDKISKAESEQSSSLSYVAQTEGELAKMRTELSSMRLRADFFFVKASREGIVSRTLKAGVGEIIKEGEAIVTIAPRTPTLAVELYLRPIDLPLVRAGTPVRVEFEGWPALQFSGWPNASVGTFAGRVYAVDFAAQTNGTFRILAVPDSTQEPWPMALRTGTRAQSWAMLKTVPVWYEVWRQLNGFPPDYSIQKEGVLRTGKDDKAKGKDKGSSPKKEGGEDEK